MIRTILFDLDGTLLDTAPDLAWALNRLRRERGHPALPLEAVRPWVSHGSIGLLRVGFDMGPEDAGFAPLRQRFLDLYQGHLAQETRLFAGMEALLGELEHRRLGWGVVTNKPGWLTEPLLEQLGLAARAACVVSGDTTARRKPDPEPMLYACRSVGCHAAECVYVGDAERDTRAGAAAGMKTLIARFGYIGPDEHPEGWGADDMVDTPMDILAWIERQNA
ncbi:MAG: HAD-IA family hydrolase [Gammaproteobacteria bacterium]|nr:HAD-IA family hydrolase [Gammaproteobacteria bacterium]NIR96556.1 HAD-IA family hydrolase [Gammaproteobacteria bacterium]NIT62294.1 HAD-IA family hydrolase [Gammaproteobacteria bacterium]NIV19198.1 HAD-IA family hydrolase [Gammaproteobacteria bacterium]NIX10066.1 HAD-IA family hydrolase [Gammaproteobacteria bacterium]